MMGWAGSNGRLLQNQKMVEAGRDFAGHLVQPAQARSPRAGLPGQFPGFFF